jgi:hypothetical protein
MKNKEQVMTPEALQKYISEDFNKALGFYDRRACSSKRLYRISSIYLIVASAILTPLVSFAPDTLIWRIILASITATVGIITGILSHFKSQENWLSYRSSWDALERERRWYETGTGPYKNVVEKEILFVERVENIRSKEGLDFYSRHAKSVEPEKGKDEKTEKKC